MTRPTRSTSTNFVQNNKAAVSWIVYVLLIGLRLIFVLLPGYVHPDEFFQSGQEALFFSSTRATVAWEFESHNAIRSVVPPWFLTVLPLRFYAFVCHLVSPGDWSIDRLSGRELLLVPRLFVALLSIFTVDVCVWRMGRLKNQEREIKCTDANNGWESLSTVPLEVIVLASSWPALVLLNRPFSNSLETMCLACLLQVIFSTGSKFSTCRCIVVGAICAAGFFSRITFASFAAPIVLLFVHQRQSHYRDLDSIKQRSSLGNYVHGFLLDSFLMALGFIVVSGLFIWADTRFYQERHNDLIIPETAEDEGLKDAATTKLFGRPIFITPLNFLAYNSNATNLSQHGLHPRYIHALVNMPMLFGPLAILWYLQLFRMWFQYKSVKNEARQTPQSSHAWPMITSTCVGIGVSGLCVLSCAPHQEPRFLLPILIPLVVSVPCQKWTGRAAVLIWIIFNGVLLGFFGGLHQAGVVPSLLELNFGAKQPAAVVFYHTYMPPLFLTRSRSPESEKGVCNTFLDDPVSQTEHNDFRGRCDLKSKDGFNEMPIIDLKGTNESHLLDTLNDLLRCDLRATGKNGIQTIDEFTTADNFVYVVAPWTTISHSSLGDDARENPTFCLPKIGFDCEKIRTYHPHITTEDFPTWEGSIRTFWSQLELNVWNLSCRHC
mmetsp:Transcript_21613/g.39091  ORF Transcript_21613/g.39091 Transcript_21613/m.39091 type:complete len:661 (-) Transcript_21613:48-2030(-)